MDIILTLIPLALLLGALGLAAFLWALHNGQFDDLSGASERILYDEEPSDRVGEASTKEEPRNIS